MKVALQRKSHPVATAPATFKPAGVTRKKCACGDSPSAGQCDDCAEERPGVQRRTIDAGDDGNPHEREAEAMAARVAGMSPPGRSSSLSSPSGSHPLPLSMRSFMEPIFGHDFSRVRVHRDGRAAESARELNAQAYTMGTDITFGSYQYAPHTEDGRRLLAHELTHVVQQSSGTAGAGGVQCRNLASPRLAGNSRFERVLDNRSVIEVGDRGPEVRQIQQLLIDLGFNLGGFGADGRFGAETETAVREFQRTHGLTDDGRVGFATIDALDAEFPSFALPANTSDPWTMSCVLGILCPWNRHLVEDVLPTFNIITFNSRTFPMEIWDGTTWVADTFDSGGFTGGTDMGFLNTETCEGMALTIYHEGWHAQQPSSLTGVVDTERDAYVNTEQWSIAMGVPGQTFDDTSTGTTEDLRTTRSGETVVDEPAAERLVRQGYGGVSSVPGERVLSRVGATDVRVRRPDGTEYTRPARNGESVRGAVNMTNQHVIPPTDWICP